MNKAMTDATILPPPTRARYKLLFLIFMLAVITYMDRQAISSAMLKMETEFKFSPTQKGYIFSAFTLPMPPLKFPADGWATALARGWR